MHFLLNFIYIITNLGLVTIATSLVCECKDRSEHVVRNMLFRPQAHRRAAAHQVRPSAQLTDFVLSVAWQL